MLQTIWFQWNEKIIALRTIFLYIIYILAFLFFFSSKYKHGKNEVTVNVQVPKQNIFLTQNTCPWPGWRVGSREFRRGPLEARGIRRTVNNPLSHHSKKSLVNNRWRLLRAIKKSQILNDISAAYWNTILHHKSCEIIY